MKEAFLLLMYLRRVLPEFHPAMVLDEDGLRLSVCFSDRKRHLFYPYILGAEDLLKRWEEIGREIVALQCAVTASCRKCGAPIDVSARGAPDVRPLDYNLSIDVLDLPVGDPLRRPDKGTMADGWPQKMPGRVLYEHRVCSKLEETAS